MTAGRVPLRLPPASLVAARRCRARRQFRRPHNPARLVQLLFTECIMVQRGQLAPREPAAGRLRRDSAARGLAGAEVARLIRRTTGNMIPLNDERFPDATGAGS
jgi:hypothetical protein